MITDDDVRKLRKVFVIKQELKDELRYQKEDLEATMERHKKEILEGVADTFHESLLPILDNHEERIVKLEKRVIAAQ